MTDLDLKESMLEAAVALRATDIHIDPASEGARARFRIDGILQLWRTCSKENGQRLNNQVKAHAGMGIGAIFEPVGERLKKYFGITVGNSANASSIRMPVPKSQMAPPLTRKCCGSVLNYLGTKWKGTKLAFHVRSGTKLRALWCPASKP